MGEAGFNFDMMLEIVRAVLNTHTDWVLLGQDLMAEIRSAVEQAPASLR